MNRIFRGIQLGLLGRRISRTLDAIESQLREQNALLRRLADHLAPLAPDVNEADLKSTREISFLSPTELIKAQDYIDRTERDIGRSPNTDEIVDYLEQEATEALHTHRTGHTL